MAKPGDYPDWATGETIQPAGTTPASSYKVIEPSGATQANGWNVPSAGSPSKPLVQEMNWLFRLNGDWVHFFYDDLLSQQHYDNGEHAAGFSVNNGAGGADLLSVTATDFDVNVSSEFDVRVTGGTGARIATRASPVAVSGGDITLDSNAEFNLYTAAGTWTAFASGSYFGVLGGDFEVRNGSGGSAILLMDVNDTTLVSADLTSFNVGRFDMRTTSSSGTVGTAGLGGIVLEAQNSLSIASDSDLYIRGYTPGGVFIAATTSYGGAYFGFTLDIDMVNGSLAAFATIDAGNGRFLFEQSTGSTPHAVANDSAASAGTGYGQLTGQSLCKAWAQIDGTTGTVDFGYNIGSVTKVGTGHYTVNFSVALNNTNYVAIPSLLNASSGNAYHIASVTHTTAGFTIQTFNSGGSNTDFDFTVMVMGE